MCSFYFLLYFCQSPPLFVLHLPCSFLFPYINKKALLANERPQRNNVNWQWLPFVLPVIEIVFSYIKLYYMNVPLVYRYIKSRKATWNIDYSPTVLRYFLFYIELVDRNGCETSTICTPWRWWLPPITTFSGLRMHSLFVTYTLMQSICRRR